MSRHHLNRRTCGRAVAAWPPKATTLPAWSGAPATEADTRWMAEMAVEHDSIVVYRDLVAVPDTVQAAARRRNLAMPATMELTRSDGRSVIFYRNQAEVTG